MPATDIDLATWPRRDHYRLFRGLANPYFGVTLEVDVTAWRRAIEGAGLPAYASMIHAMTCATNAVEAFRLRIRGERVVRHDVVHPSFTVPWGEDLFNFVVLDHDPDLDAFLARCVPAIAAASAAPALAQDPPGKDDMVFLSCLPWLAFTGLTQAAGGGDDAFPRLVWGRFTERDGRVAMPLQVQVHHALADGLHVARFVAALEGELAATAARLAARAGG